MTAQQIRTELGQLLASGAAVPADLQRLSQEWRKAKLNTLPAYFEVIEARLRELRHEVRESAFDASAENIAACSREVWGDVLSADKPA